MRLFYGLSLLDFVSRETARIARQSESLIAGRYSEVSNHHITLAFLGEVPPERLSDAERILQKHAAAFPAPTLTLEIADYFGKPDSARQEHSRARCAPRRADCRLRPKRAERRSRAFFSAYHPRPPCQNLAADACRAGARAAFLFARMCACLCKRPRRAGHSALYAAVFRALSQKLNQRHIQAEIYAN